MPNYLIDIFLFCVSHPSYAGIFLYYFLKSSLVSEVCLDCPRIASIYEYPSLLSKSVCVRSYTDLSEVSLPPG